jgi:hypothetical protein
MPNKNSKFSSSCVAKLSGSLFALASSLVFATLNKASFIWADWYLISLTLSIRLSQRVVDNVLRVKPSI